MHIDDLFAFNMLNEEGRSRAGDIAYLFHQCLEGLRLLCPEGTREFALAKTKLEEACFYAKKSMAIQPTYKAK